MEEKYYKDLYGAIIIVLKYTHLLCLHSIYKWVCNICILWKKRENKLSETSYFPFHSNFKFANNNNKKKRVEGKN